MSKLRGEVLYGVAPVLMALKNDKRALHRLYVQEGMDPNRRKDASAVADAVRMAGSAQIDVEYASKHDLNMLADNRPHQGLVLDCGPLEWAQTDAFPEAEGQRTLWLALDEVYDPQNFGAILRSAYFLGVAGVMACKRNSAPLSGVVSKASAGALEDMTVHSCSNLPKALQQAREGGWQVLGADSGPGSVSCSGFVLEQPTILVVGNEGYGLRTNVRRACDQTIQVDRYGGEESALAVDSLNVSVATGVLLHSLLSSAKAL